MQQCRLSCRCLSVARRYWCVGSTCDLEGSSAVRTNVPLTGHFAKILIDVSLILNGVLCTVYFIESDLIAINVTVNYIELTDFIETLS